MLRKGSWTRVSIRRDIIHMLYCSRPLTVFRLLRIQRNSVAI